MAKKFAEHNGLNLTKTNNDVLAEWEKNDIFHKSIDEREGCPQFIFFEGPPSANGHPGIHHVLARSIKDTFNRYKTMKGFQVHRKAGWDTHGKYNGTFTVYGHEKALKVLEWICRMTLPAKLTVLIGKSVLLHEVKDKDELSIGDIKLQYFDILSTKEKQFGLRALLPDGTTLACLGDEPYNENNKNYVENADWLLCEAFCLYKDRDIFKPYEKHHSTALEAGALADKLNVKNLLLYHTEDESLATRKANYTEEAAQNFKGNIFVPYDLETINI